uniref:Serine/threonine kinase 31 n=1 Tax=Calidris pygmaea TaxID=425635 RepID=A0A8C3PHT4_9CHAR
MDGDTERDKVEDVVGSHVEDAVTFWAQDVSKCNDLLKLSCALAEACPQANAVFGKPDFSKIYGGCFSEDGCWYRCMVEQVINNEKCQVLYIDYGNSEVLNRSDIVEIPPNLQCPSVAKKYRLWGLQIPTDQSLNMFDEGKKFLSRLIFEKGIKIRHKGKHEDGTIIAQAEYEKIDIGKEVVKAGFAEECMSPGNTKDVEERKVDVMQNQHRKTKVPARLCANRSRSDHALDSIPRRRCDPVAASTRNQKTATKFEETLDAYIGTKMRSLAAKVKALKEVRHTNKNSRFREQLSESIQVVTEGRLTVPCSLEKLQKIWTEYDLAQERIRLCRNVDGIDELIAKRDEVQQNLYSAAEELILEVDQLPLSERSRTLQELSASLEMVYGQGSAADDLEDAFQQFFEWKSVKMKKLIRVREDTDIALKILADWFSSILKDNSQSLILSLCNSIQEPDEAEKGIIMNAYNKVIYNVRQEQSMITVIQNRYLASVEFKQRAEEWLNRRPDISNLLSIKKTMKSLKAQLRWKLVEKNNFEESDDYSEFEMTGIKEEIAHLRNRVLQEISKEQEEYEKLTYLVQKWFPELPLLYPEAGILNYMNSGGLLTHSLERDLLDAEPMKELSTKRPLVCSEIRGQKVLLKGYSVDVSSEAKVIERAAKYHRAWDKQKEKSGLLQLLFLLFCKSDPLIYLMVPYYPGASLGALQADTPLSLEEALKVMKGVAQGLQMLHGANLVHGSLHGNNVFAVDRKQGIVGDFDFTKPEEQRAAANTMVVGTLSLVSPELKMGQPASPASDMYAYGCLLFWLCVQNQEFGIKEDGTPEVDAVVMDDKVKSLLLNLFCCNRLTAEQVLRDDCFLTVDVIPVSPHPGEEHEPREEHDSEKTDEKKNVIT